jgi:hypothetical protein
MKQPKIKMIKELRQRVNCGLKEAKDAIEAAMEKRHTEADVIALACHNLDPVRFPHFGNTERDYKAMWNRLICISSPAALDAMGLVMKEDDERIENNIRKLRDFRDWVKTHLEMIIANEIISTFSGSRIFTYSEETSKDIPADPQVVVDIIEETCQGWIQHLRRSVR